MIASLLLLQFLAHLMADYVFQPHAWTMKKRKGVFTRYHLMHGLVVFVFSWLLSFDFGFWKAALVLTILHLLTDLMKSYAQTNWKPRKNDYFFSDQLIHLIIIVAIVMSYHYWFGIQFWIDIPLRIIAVASGYVFCLKPANILIKHIFITFSIESPLENRDGVSGTNRAEEKSLPNAGKVIGVVERLLVFSLILVGQFSAVGFILAAKSILRFKDNQKNEYILVGTLLSFGIAILLGIAVS